MGKDKEEIEGKSEKKGSSSKSKKKWSKAKVKEKLNNAVLFDKATYDKVIKEVPQWKLITPSLISERMKITASLAKRAIDDLVKKGLIQPVVHHHALLLYTRKTSS